ncbi:MAG TPA: ceramide glucosyltransferase [Planctomycetota bacterium]|nr:ceramide glucosyltransferase [Planctomycetota bacterium]
MMVTIASLLSLLVALNLFLVLLQAMAQRAVIETEAPPLPKEFPPVSILKPLKGVDADLKENLRSLYRIEYPNFEVILGTEDARDPALALAQRVAAEFPDIRSVVLSSGTAIGFNPKVNNLANLVLRARHPLLLISDSNVRVPQDYLKDLVAHRVQAGGGLVWSLFRGIHGSGLGGMLEAMQLNNPVMGGVSALMRVLRVPCCVGKSMLLHRDELEAIGGFRFLGQFLAEDQVCAEEFDRLGRPVTVSGNLIDNVLGRRTLREFIGRHLRWARLRRHVHLAGYVGEILLNPVFVALVALAAVRTPDAAIVAGLTLIGMSVMNASTDRVLGLRKPAWAHPLLELALSVSRGVLWFVPFFSRTVVWRGNVLALGPRSQIELKEAAPVDDGLFDTRERHAPA